MAAPLLVMVRHLIDPGAPTTARRRLLPVTLFPRPASLPDFVQPLTR